MMKEVKKNRENNRNYKNNITHCNIMEGYWNIEGQKYGKHNEKQDDDDSKDTNNKNREFYGNDAMIVEI